MKMPFALAAWQCSIQLAASRTTTMCSKLLSVAAVGIRRVPPFGIWDVHPITCSPADKNCWPGPNRAAKSACAKGPFINDGSAPGVRRKSICGAPATALAATWPSGCAGTPARVAWRKNPGLPGLGKASTLSPAGPPAPRATLIPILATAARTGGISSPAATRSMGTLDQPRRTAPSLWDWERFIRGRLNSRSPGAERSQTVPVPVLTLQNECRTRISTEGRKSCGWKDFCRVVTSDSWR